MSLRSPSLQQLEEVILALCEDTGTPRSLTVFMLLKAGEYAQLFNLKTVPGNYLNPHRYRQDVIVSDFLRKLDFDIPGIDKEAVALDNFWLAEKACCKTNLRLSPFVNNGPFEDPNDERVCESIARMKEWIARTLGEIPEDLFDSRFGPGSTFRDVGQLITVPDKIENRPTMTSLCTDLLPLWERTAWARAQLEVNPGQSRPEVLKGNRFTTVPKDALRYRGIAIEASINVFLQLGIGSHLKKRLLRSGVDLKDGQDMHRQVACEASRTGELCTVDLSNASDMNAYKLVELLLPRKWFDLLRSCRSPSTLVNGQWVHLQKFSSMGNGYTFELETLIFMAIALEACYLTGEEGLPGSNLFVYGDDIIAPVKAAPTLLALLAFFGHQPNQKKTFTQGHFRESCGGDFFAGVPVRAHYVKEVPCEPAHWISIANGLRRLFPAEKTLHSFRESVYWRAWLRALDQIPADIRRLRGPVEFGDLVIHDDRQFWQRRRTPDQRTFIRTWMPFTKALPFHHWKGPVVFAAALYGCSQEGILPRENVSGYRHKWVSYLE